MSLCGDLGFWVILCGNEMENDASLTDVRDQLIRKTAHDVRTPLTSIAGFADLIAEDNTVPENAREFAGIIKEEIQRLSDTLDDFFDQVRTEKGENQ